MNLKTLFVVRALCIDVKIFYRPQQRTGMNLVEKYFCLHLLNKTSFIVSCIAQHWQAAAINNSKFVLAPKFRSPREQIIYVSRWWKP